MAKNETRYELKHPVTMPGATEETKELTLSRKLKYLRGANVSVGVGAEGSKDMATIHMDMGQLVDLAGKMAGLLPAQMEELHSADQGYLIGQAQDFLFSSLGTGPNS